VKNAAQEKRKEKGRLAPSGPGEMPERAQKAPFRAKSRGEGAGKDTEESSERESFSKGRGKRTR